MNRTDTIFSARVGVNADIFKDIVKLYVPDGSLVVDLTFGLGRFWTYTMLEHRTLIACDLSDRFPKTKPLFGNIQYMRVKAPDLPFRDESVGCVVFDPPYANFSPTARTGNLCESYGLASLTGINACKLLYFEVIRELDRILEIDGVAIIKCQDAVNNGENHWMHHNIYEDCVNLNFFPEDLFVLVSENVMVDPRIKQQQHARKNHSFFWVFRKRK